MSAPLTRWSRAQIGLHWGVALLILAAWATGEGMGQAFRARLAAPDAFPGFTTHTLIGGTVLVLVVVRLLLRATQGAPDPVPGTSPRMAQAATWGHRLLYVLMLGVPALGAAAWYGGLEAPAEVHETVGNLILFVAGAHALVALAHHYVLRDDTLRRMLPRLG
jgi:cytochrome b561